MRHVPHNNNLPVPKPPEEWILDELDEETALGGTGSDVDPDYERAPQVIHIS